MNEPTPENPIPVADLLLSPEQKGRMEAIEQASDLLSAAKVPFMLFASPDDVSAAMKFTSAHQLSYASDLFSIPVEVNVAKGCLIGVVLTQLTKGAKGAIYIVDDSGAPLYGFQQGRMRPFKTEKKVTI